MITAPIGSREYFEQLIDAAINHHAPRIERYGVVCCMACKYEVLRVTTVDGVLHFMFMDATDPNRFDGTCPKCKAQVWPEGDK
jgi:hypothetical protein